MCYWLEIIWRERVSKQMSLSELIIEAECLIHRWRFNDWIERQWGCAKLRYQTKALRFVHFGWVILASRIPIMSRCIAAQKKNWCVFSAWTYIAMYWLTASRQWICNVILTCTMLGNGSAAKTECRMTRMMCLISLGFSQEENKGMLIYGWRRSITLNMQVVYLWVGEIEYVNT